MHIYIPLCMHAGFGMYGVLPSHLGDVLEVVTSPSVYVPDLIRLTGRKLNSFSIAAHGPNLLTVWDNYMKAMAGSKNEYSLPINRVQVLHDMRE